MFGFNKKKTIEHGDEEIVAVTSGTIIPNSQVSDPVFASEAMGKTVTIRPIEKNISVVSPINGTLEVIFPSGHAFAVRGKDDLGVLVHIGIDTVALNGKGFKIMAKQGEKVKAGQEIIKADFKYIKAMGYDISTMTIVSENPNSRVIEFKENTNIEIEDSIIK